MRMILYALLCIMNFSASAQIIEKNKSEGVSSEIRKSTDSTSANVNSRTATRTYTPGGLFFHVFGEMENDGKSYYINYSTGQVPCKVLIGQYVWGNNRGIVIETKRMTNGGGAVTNWGEGASMKLKSSETMYVYEALNYLPKPTSADTYISCYMIYRAVMKIAVYDLIKDARRDGDVYWLKDIQAVSREKIQQAMLKYKALTESTPSVIAWQKSIGTDGLDGGLDCQIPTASGFMGGQTSFQCQQWVVQQRPLMIYKYNQLILSDDTIDGVKYQFADANDLTEAVSKSSSKSRATNSTTSQGQKIKTQRN